MTPFPRPLNDLAAPLMVDNVDTDTIIPSREMRSTGRTGLADGMFAPWRYIDAATRTENPEFVLNHDIYRGARILAAGANFGCGSSREHAVWALAEYGIRAVIAESFAPIFRGNCIRNGILPIILPRETVEELAGQRMAIDLEICEIRTASESQVFSIDPEARQMLLEGLDAIDLTLTQRGAIDDWTTADRQARPWIYLNPPQSRIGEGDHAQHGGGVSRNPPPPPKPPKTVVRARELRRTMTLPENLLWQRLKVRPGGFKFRRQHSSGPYVLDFYCAAARLCVEIDGKSHDAEPQAEHDRRRDAYLAQAGIATLRLPAQLVLKEVEMAIQTIVTEAEGRIPLHRPADGPPPQSEIGEV